MINSRRLLLFAAVGVALIVLIAALFRFSGQSPNKAAGPPEKVTIAVASIMNSTLVRVAEVKGFFREAGLDVTVQVHPFGKIALQSVLDGKADLATVAETPIMFAMMEKADISILATIQTSDRNEAIVALKDRGISSATDLKGHRVGVPLGTSADYYLDSYLVVQGMTRKDITIVDMMPETMSEALLQGKVDAVSVWNPEVTNLSNALGDRGILFRSDLLLAGTFNVVSLRKFALERSEAIRRLLRALVKAEEFVAANPQESQRIMSEFCGIDMESLRDIWNDFQFNITMNQALLIALEGQARWAIRTGMTDRRDMPEFFWALYFDGLTAVKPEAVRVIK